MQCVVQLTNTNNEIDTEEGARFTRIYSLPYTLTNSFNLFHHIPFSTPNHTHKKINCVCIVMPIAYVPRVYSLIQIRYDDDDEDEGPQPDATLEQGAPIPVRLQAGFPPELASTPLEDIDMFYSNQLVSNLFAMMMMTIRPTFLF